MGGGHPVTLRHPRSVQRIGFALVGPLQRLFEHVDAKPGEYTDKDISPYFWHNGKYPDTDEYERSSTASSRTTGCASAAWWTTRSN